MTTETEKAMAYQPSRWQRWYWVSKARIRRIPCHLGRHQWVFCQLMGYSDDREEAVAVMKCTREWRKFRLGYAWRKTSEEWEIHF